MARIPRADYARSDQMERMNKVANEVEQAGNEGLKAKWPSSELRTLDELELMLAGGGDHTVEWP